MKKIAIDAMGGDNAPKAIIEGVNQAIETFPDIDIQLYGDQLKLRLTLFPLIESLLSILMRKFIQKMSLQKPFVEKRMRQWF